MGMLFGGVSCGILLFNQITGRGRHDQRVESKVDDLVDQIKEMKTAQAGEAEDFKETQRVMDSHLRTLSTSVQNLTQEWRGLDGTNGYKSVIRGLVPRVEAIEKRNNSIDSATKALKEYEEKKMRELDKPAERLRDRVEGVGQDDI